MAHVYIRILTLWEDFWEVKPNSFNADFFSHTYPVLKYYSFTADDSRCEFSFSPDH